MTWYVFSCLLVVLACLIDGGSTTDKQGAGDGAMALTSGAAQKNRLTVGSDGVDMSCYDEVTSTEDDGTESDDDNDISKTTTANTCGKYTVGKSRHRGGFKFNLSVCKNEILKFNGAYDVECCNDRDNCNGGVHLYSSWVLLCASLATARFFA